MPYIGNNPDIISEGVATKSVDALVDVDTVSDAPLVGQVLKWNGENWVPQDDTGTGGGGGGGGVGISDGDKGDITVSNSGATWSIDNDVVGSDELANTSVTAGSYTNTDITVDDQGRITSASNGANTDTLDTVTSRGSTTTNDINVGEVLATGLKLNTNTVSSSYSNVSGTIGDIKRINEHPHYYDGTTWRSFYLSGTPITTATSDVHFDDVQVRFDFEGSSDAFNYVNQKRAKINNLNASSGANVSLVTSPSKYGTQSMRIYSRGGSASGDCIEWESMPNSSYNSLWSTVGAEPYNNPQVWSNTKRGGSIDWSADWTLEFWIRIEDVSITSNNTGIFHVRNSAYASGFGLMLSHSSQCLRWVNHSNQSSAPVDLQLEAPIAGTYVDGAWNFISLTYDSSSGEFTLHRNGTNVTYNTPTDNNIPSANGNSWYTRFGTFETTGTYATEYLSKIHLDDLRLTQFARYDSNNYTAPTGTLPITVDAPPTVDPDWSNVIVRSTFDTNSNNIAANGGAPSTQSSTSQIITTNAKYGTAALRHDSDNAYLTYYSINSPLDVSGTWTIEFWIDITTVGAIGGGNVGDWWRTIWSQTDGAGSNDYSFGLKYTTNNYGYQGISENAFKFFWRNDATTYELHHDHIPLSLLSSQYNHVALVRDGSGNMRVFFNGYKLRVDASDTSVFTDTGVTYSSTNSMRIGNAEDDINANDDGFEGFLDDLRITTTVKYTDNFTPPSGPLPTTGTITNNPPGTPTSGYLTYPTGNGTTGQVLTSDGTGNVTWTTVSGGGVGAVVGDTTPQLGGDLDLNSNNITGTGNITLGTYNSGAQVVADQIVSGIGAPGTGAQIILGVYNARVDDVGGVEQNAFNIGNFNDLNSMQIGGRGTITTKSDVNVGGNLRLPGGTFANNQIQLGTNQEFTFQYNTAITRGLIQVSGQDLDIRASTIRLQPNGGENGINVNLNGSVELYHDNGKKLETTGTGVTVTGDLTADSFDLSTNNTTIAGTSGTAGQFKQIAGAPFYYDGTAWREVVLSDGTPVTTSADTDWDNVLIRLDFEQAGTDVTLIENEKVLGDGTRVNPPNTSDISTDLVGSPVKFGTKALRFDGSQAVNFPLAWDNRDTAQNRLYTFEGAFTIELWVYLSELPGTGECFPIVSQSEIDSTPDDDWSLNITRDASSTTYLFNWYNQNHSSGNVNSGYGTIIDARGGSTLLNQWNHIALVREAGDSSIHFYFNGTESTYTNGTTASLIDATVTDSSTSDYISFGYHFNLNSASRYFTGVMDDVRISKSARYTSNFTAPTSAFPISGSSTTVYTPPGSKQGEIALGSTPVWTGTTGVTVSRQSSGLYRLSFASAFASSTAYTVHANAMDYPGTSLVGVGINRISSSTCDLSVYRLSDTTLVDIGSLSISVYKK